ncbi:MAG: TIGR00266 family protein [Lachnospiraceae bacterium]|nr:TIGR00266 family protein [Lachnospiraceae bacterium]
MKYEIKGTTFPVVVMYPQRGETIVCESGAMTWMSDNMKMNATTGGGIGKMFSRMFSDESLMQDTYTAEGGPGMLACASRFPGMIKPFEISPGNSIVIQKSAFLCSEKGVDTSIYFQKKIGVALFGGEGFIMQKISGNGLCFAEFNGDIVKYNLEAGQKLIVDTGNLAACTDGCSIDIQSVPGVKNALFGGEGLFNTVITGPGSVWVQTMSLPSFVSAIAPLIPKDRN